MMMVLCWNCVANIVDNALLLNACLEGVGNINTAMLLLDSANNLME